VLVAVILTTLISVGAGYERNVTVSLDQIPDERVRQLAREYGDVLGARDEAIEERIDVSTRLDRAVREHGGASEEAIEIEAGHAKLSVRVERLRERAGQVRAELRAMRLRRREDGTGDVSYVLPAEGEDGSWRLDIGSRKLDEDAVTLIGGGRVVGVVPAGIPSPVLPDFGLGTMLALLPMAAIISLLGFMEAISIAKAMAARTGHRLDPNQELIGQGLANIAGAFTRSYPVSGSFSRSAVNLQAGAVTGLSNVFSSAVVLVTLLFLTPLLYHLPQSVLAAIIMMAVLGLVNVSGFVHAWRAQKLDGVIAVTTFVATLLFAPHLDRGIFLGIVLSLAVFLYRNMRPEIAVLSQTPDGSYRNAERWNLERCRHVAVIRLNGSLFFANVSFIEDRVLEQVASMPELRHVLIVGNGMNDIDASGEVALSKLVSWLRERGLEVSFTGLNDRVLEVMERTHLLDKIGHERFFQSVTHAVLAIHGNGECIEDDGRDCPLVRPRFEAHEVAPGALPEEGRRPWWVKERATAGEDSGDEARSAPPARGED
jgi:anti-anti-sigma regulatory factor